MSDSGNDPLVWGLFAVCLSVVGAGMLTTDGGVYFFGLASLLAVVGFTELLL